MGQGYEESKKIALKTIIILGVITVVEVLVALLGKGYLIEGVSIPWYIMNLLMIGMSAFKAYLIVYEFMHMKYEVKALALSVVLPTLLLVWAIIAFLYEGNGWFGNRDTINAIDEKVVEESIQPIGGVPAETIELNDAVSHGRDGAEEHKEHQHEETDAHGGH